MAGERDIEYLLSKYKKAYVKGEIRPRNTQKKIRGEGKRKHRHLILNELIKEAEPQINLTPNQIRVIRYLIDDFNEEFQTLHRRASEECIILAFIFYMKKIETSRLQLSNYHICTQYGLTDLVFEIILCRMLLKFMKRCPILPSKYYSKDEHDKLIREGTR